MCKRSCDRRRPRVPLKPQQFQFFLFKIGFFFVSTLFKSAPGYLSWMAGARWPDLLPPPRPLTSKKERAINRGRRATLLPATHMHTHSYAYNRSFLPASLCTCKAVSRPPPQPPTLQRPSKISQVQTKPPAEPNPLSAEASGAQRTNTHLSSQEACLTGEIYLPHINEKRGPFFSHKTAWLSFEKDGGGGVAGAIFNHPVHPHAEPHCL